MLLALLLLLGLQAAPAAQAQRGDSARGEASVSGIGVNRTFLWEELSLGAAASQALKLTNSGNTSLSWSLAEDPLVAWLSESLTSGALAPGASIEVQVTFDSVGLPVGVYTSTVKVQSDEPGGVPTTLPVRLQVAETGVSLASGTVAAGQTILLDITVRNVTDPMGLGAYQLHIRFPPAKVQFETMTGGDPPFKTPPVYAVSNTYGALEFGGFQATMLPGPIGDMVIARVAFRATGNPGDVATLDLLVAHPLPPDLGLWNANADPFPSYDIDGSVTVISPAVAVTGLATGVDADKAAGAMPSIPKVKELGSGDPLPNVLIKSYAASLTYNGSLLQVLDVRLKPPFETGGVAIDNAGGITQFSASAPNGVPWPIDPLAFITLRLTGCFQDSPTLTATFGQVLDTNGYSLGVAQAQARTFKRGDANSDAAVWMADVLWIAQYVVGIRDVGDGPTLVNPVNSASVKHDGAFDKITVADALYLAQMMVGLRDGCFNLYPVATPPLR